MRLPTASQIERVMTCNASAVLPHYDRETPDAERGTAIHAFLATVPRIGREAALELVPEKHRGYCALIPDLPQLVAGAFAHEVALRFNLQSGEAVELGRGGEHRDYPVDHDPWDTFGTLDVLGIDDEAIHIYDWKAGFHRSTWARDNWQLRWGALAACRAYDRRAAVVGLIYLDDDGEPRLDSARFDDIDLDVFEYQLTTLYDTLLRLGARFDSGQVPLANLPYRTGRACSYCPAFRGCGAQLSFARALMLSPDQTLDLLTAFAGGMMDPAVVAEVKLRSKAAHLVLDVIDRAVDEYAKLHPIDLGGGMVYGPIQKKRSTLDGQRVYAWLLETYDEATARAATELRSSQTKIKEAIRPHAPPRGLGKLEASVHAELHRVGAMKTFEYESLTEHRARPGELDAPGAVRDGDEEGAA